MKIGKPAIREKSEVINTLIEQIRDTQTLINGLKEKQKEYPESKLIKVMLNQDESLLKSLKYQLEITQRHYPLESEIFSDTRCGYIDQGTSCYDRNKIRISCSVIGEGSRTF